MKFSNFSVPLLIEFDLQWKRLERLAESEGKLHNVAGECKGFIFRLFVKFLYVFCISIFFIKALYI